jgi:hypothetical protein
VKSTSFLACLLLLGSAEAQDRPFVFTVTTSPLGSSSSADSRSWTAYYDSGYGEQAGEPFGYDGVEQRFGVQGRLGAGFTLLGHVGLGIGDAATRSSQQAEVLKDVLDSTSRVRVAIGVGARREWEGTNAALARVCLGWSSRSTMLFGNALVEKPFAPGRDAVDLITTLGWLQSVGHGLRLGVEAVGEDLEGFWEAEGGRRRREALRRPRAALDGPCGSALGVGWWRADRLRDPEPSLEPSPPAAGRHWQRLHDAGVGRLHVLGLHWVPMLDRCRRLHYLS